MKYKDAPFYQAQDFETIFGYAWMIYKRYFGWLFFYSFLGILLIQALIYTFFPNTIAQLYQVAENPQAPMGNLLQELGLFVAVFFLIYALLYLFLFYFIIGKTLFPEKSHLTLFAEAVQKYYLHYLLTMALVFAVLFFGTIAGLILFIIGALFTGLFFGTVLFPSAPILIVEEIKPIQVIPRCFQLVLKDFWRVLGFVIVFYTIIVLFSMIFSAISMAPYAGKFLHTVFNAAGPETVSGTSGMLQPMQNPVYIVLNSLFNALIIPLTPIFSVLVYFHLKFREDQSNPSSAGSVI
ncbi:MAG: hypothetical protein GXO83_03090 [Chlorobi bacterium]|nr:hypothetical protein [Chlorobiota bacterium]